MRAMTAGWSTHATDCGFSVDVELALVHRAAATEEGGDVVDRRVGHDDGGSTLLQHAHSLEGDVRGSLGETLDQAGVVLRENALWC